MLDIKYIRDNLNLCREAAKNKNREVDWDKLLGLDEKRRTLIGEAEKLRGERNKSGGAASDEKAREAGRLLKEKLKKIEEELRSVEGEFEEVKK